MERFAHVRLLDTGSFVVEGDDIYPVVLMVDDLGEDTKDIDKAVIVVGGPDRKGKWVTIDITHQDWVLN